MTKLTFFLLCISFLMACGQSKNTKKEAQELLQEMSETTQTPTPEEAKNCEEFIDQYEKWTDDYVKLMEKYQKNPMDAELMNKYMQLAQEGSNWLLQWNGKLAMCASHEKYQKRFDEISEKMDKKMKELGLD
ncbi:DUF6591 domain-containing protein [uncultured Draconibacterium sp.]|uniref:DUF6591 domain-containing protein n=1 Tax=uncultured Draconibacterium sp. TaxID=1573823 RepID=UPI0029C64B1A|nr:DUF6591 domain-containing protein [uncultured Draconibacterium sp.]